MASFSASTTSRKPMWVALLVITAALIARPPTAEAAVSCDSVLNFLTPCLGFVLVGGSLSSSSQCCNGVKSVFNIGTTKEDRQAVCTCLKSLVGSATPGMLTNAAALPGKCSVTSPYAISPSTDCSRVN